MSPHSLEFLQCLDGIASASGIYHQDGHVYVVSDNAGLLYVYTLSSGNLQSLPMIEGVIMENIPKRIKPDFEALAERDGKLYLFGSGSTDARNLLVEFDLARKSILRRENLGALYEKMRKASLLLPEDFNIEGALFDGKRWLLFQRGNGKNGKNGVFTVSDLFDADTSISFSEIILPKIDGATSSFTDAVLVDGDIWFLATAEDTQSTYDDGEIIGSLVGKMDAQTMQPSFTEQISGSHKFEGIAFLDRGDANIRFLLCEDDDSGYPESKLFLLTIATDATKPAQ